MLKDIRFAKITQINVEQDEIFIPVFENKIEKIDLLNKLEPKENKMLSSRAEKFGFIGEKNQFLSYKNLHFFGIGDESKFLKNHLPNILSKLFSKAKKEKHLVLHLYIPKSIQDKFDGEFDLGRVVAESFHSSQYEFYKYKSGTKSHTIEELVLIMEGEFDDQILIKALDYSKAIMLGVGLTRDLINEPASVIHPETLVKTATEIVEQSNGLFEIEVLDDKKCLELGMNAYLAVAKGSEKKPKFIIIKYLPNSDVKPIVLVGKTITFDSGGLSIKPADGMNDMKIDMSGGAIVLGFFKALSMLPKKINKNIIGILPACENMPFSSAMIPGDVVKAMNGKTIEIVNTDAEGRLTLADALSYATEKLRPDIIIDIATLTGNISRALGPDYAGLFSNDPDFSKMIVDSGKEENELLWGLPMPDDYNQYIESGVADLCNISKIRMGGAITASLFLKNFITDKIRWAHIDLGETVYKKTATGWGVRTVINLLNKIV